ncbi:unnamed protein product, partial [Oikopleura dioica]
ALKNFATSTIPNFEHLLQELSKLTENCAASDSDDTLETKKDKTAMSLLDELKGIVIDQQRGIRERDTKLASLQQQYDALNTSYWTIMQKVRSYDHFFGILTSNAKNSAASGSPQTSNGISNLPSSVPTPSLAHTEEAQVKDGKVRMNLNFICKETRGATETKEENPDVETKPDIGAIASSTINPAIFSLANSFALDRFAGVSMMNLGTFNKDLSPEKKMKMKSPVKTMVKFDGQTKPYTCKVCGRRFTDRSNCIKHQFIHTGLKPFECPHCNKRFRRKDHLNSHSKSQHGEEAFPPGVPAPRLSIVAATSQLPNIIGNMNNASMLSNGSLKNYEECSIEVDDEDNTSFDEPSPKKIKVEENEFEEEDLTIDELPDNNENIAVQPAEVEPKPAFSKEMYDKIMNE